MKNKILSVFLSLAVVMPIINVAANAAERATVSYSTIIKSDGWTDSQKIWQQWETGSGKALGVANQISYGTGPLQRAVQNSADPVSGELNSVKFPIKTGNTNAFIIFASRNHAGGEKTSIYVPNSSKMAYLEYELYTTSELPQNINLSVKTTDNRWIDFNYTPQSGEINKWIGYSIPLSDFVSTNVNYTWRDIACIDVMKFRLPAAISRDGDIYMKNMRISYAPMLSVKAEESGDGICLSYTTDAKDVTGYSIYRSGALIAENVTQTTYIDTAVSANNDYTYKVIAFNASGELVSAQTSISFKPGDKFIRRLIYADGMFNDSAVDKDEYLNGVCCYNGSNDIKAASPVRRNNVEDVYCVKYDIDADTAQTLNSGTNPRLQIRLVSGMKFPLEHISDGYVRLKLYVQTDTEANLPLNSVISVKNANGEWKEYSCPIDKSQVKPNQWNDLVLRLKDFSGTKKQLYPEITGINIRLPRNISPCSYYISDMALCYNKSMQGDVYKEQKILDSEELDSVSDGIIMYEGAKNAVVKGYMRKISDGAYAYINGSEMYVPLEYTLSSLGFSDDAYTAAAGEKLSDSCKYAVTEKESILYAAASDISILTGIPSVQNAKLVIFSANAADISDSLSENLRAALSWENGRMNLTAEGFITGITAHPLDGNIRYARTDVGGCYRWIPETNSWKQLMCNIPYEETNLICVNGFAVDPNNKDIIYILCGGNSEKQPHYLLKSYDRGETWENTYFDMPSHNGFTRFGGERVAVDPNNSDIVYVGTFADGLWKSADAGKTWSRIGTEITASANEGINAVVFDANSGIAGEGSEVIYVSAFDSGLYKSTDAGESFVKVDAGVSRIMRMRMHGSSLYFTAVPTDTYAGGFFRYSTSGGLENLNPHNDKMTMTGAVDFMIDYTNPNFMIVASYNPAGNRWRTRDGGKTWDYFRSEDYVNNAAFLQDPSKPRRLLECTGRGLWTYENIYEEDLYNNVEYGREQTNIEELVALKVMSIPDSKAPMLLAGVYDSSFLYCENKTDAAVLQWYELNKKAKWGIAVDMDYCNSNPKYVMRVARQQEGDYETDIVFSDNYGRDGQRCGSWLKSNPAFAGAVSAGVQSNGYPIAIIAEPKNADGSAGALYRTTDWGTSWQKLSGVDIYTGSDFWAKYREYVLISDSADPNTFYFYTGSDFYVSRDTGLTWQSNTYLSDNFGLNGKTVSLTAVPGKAGEIFLTASGEIFKTEDFGSTWEQVSVADNAKYISFGKGRCEEPAMYMYGTVNGVEGLYISDDMGSSFRRIDNDGIHFLNEVAQIAGDMNLYGRVFVSLAGTGIMWFEDTRRQTETHSIFAVKQGTLSRTESIQNCEAGEVIDIYARGTDNSKPYRMTAASYGAGGELKSVSLFAPNTNKVSYTAADGASTVKIMMWSDTDGMIPIAHQCKITVFR